MAEAVPSPVLQAVRRVVEDQRAKELPDQELLRRFTALRDEAAFHTLLRRHGPMVFGVCRALLPSEPDAEDAFQATFLVFARKAGSIRRSASLGSWLHGVAYRTARKARAAFARRQKHEGRALPRGATSPEDWSWREVQRVVHEELSGISERYRAPLALCYLQGETLDEAAAQLGVAKGTLKARLERGRRVLRARLVRRGLGPAAVLLASAWPGSATAGWPAGLLHSTLRAALRVATGRATAGLVSANVASLTEGVLNAMSITRLKILTAALTVLTCVGLSLGGLAYTAPAGQPGAGGGGQPTLPAGARRAPAEQDAIAALQAVGGRIIRDRTQPGEPVVGVYLLSRDVRDEHLRHLKEFKGLKTLVLTGVTDASLKELRGLKSLEYLRARSSHTEGALKDLGELTNLRELDLDGFDEAGLKDLSGLKHLRVLKIIPWRATPGGLSELKGLKELRRLELEYVFSTPDERRNVEAGLKELSELPRLEELVLKGGMLDDGGLRQLARFKSLRALHLANNNVTDVGLAALKVLPNLRRVLLQNTRVTDAGVADLRGARPALEVTNRVGRPVPAWADYQRITGKAQVLDARTLLFADGTRIPLNLKAPLPGEPGAEEAAAFLAGLVGDQAVTCYLVEAQLAYVCYAGDVNVEHAMIINGWARSDHSGMVPAETIARENRRGLWGGKFGEPPR
jgi:RNA polymerase sigma factor (sigma-70 family)